MKLREKIRDKGEVQRKYDVPTTPYQRLLRSGQISKKNKEELQNLYQSLNPGQLKRKIDEKLKQLYEAYEEKKRGNEISPFKKRTLHLRTLEFALSLKLSPHRPYPPYQ